MKYESLPISAVIEEIAMGPFGSNIKVECFTDSGIPVLNGSNVGGFCLSEENFRYVTPEKAKSLGNAVAHKGDIVITHRGTLGQVVFIPNDSLFDEYIISQSQFRVRCNSRVYPEYLVYYFHTPYGRHQLLSNASQVGVPALARPTSTFQKLVVKIPDIDVQRKVIAIVESIQQKIRINEKENDNLLQQADLLFKSWFLDYAPWDGNIPESWISGKLGEYTEIKRGGSPRPIQEYLSDSGLRWLKISDVTSLSSPFVIDIKDHIIESGLRKTVLLSAGSLVLSNSATPGIPKILDVDSCIHDGWLYFPKSVFSKEFLYLYFRYIRQQLVNLSNGSVFNNLKTDILKEYPTTLPDSETLHQFDEIVKPMFDRMQGCARESHKLAELRDALLPRLMSGEIDVSNITF